MYRYNLGKQHTVFRKVWNTKKRSQEDAN